MVNRAMLPPAVSEAFSFRTYMKRPPGKTTARMGLMPPEPKGPWVMKVSWPVLLLILKPEIWPVAPFEVEMAVTYKNPTVKLLLHEVTPRQRPREVTVARNI